MIDQKKNFNKFLTHDINEVQQTAVKHRHGSLLVVAGAGSGKTRVITARIANLILNEQVNPASIIALTFTNKAAKEMQERIRQFLGGGVAIPFIGTFHSYCLRILKTNANKLSTPFISILDADDQQRMLHGIIARHNLQKQISAQQLGYQISQIKNHAHNPEQMPFSYAQTPFIKQLFVAYQEEKAASRALDFDDLLLETLKLFKKDKEFAASFHKTIEHILVDEYQDTNVVQHELLLAMAKDNKKVCVDSICVVGDEDQSIYSWRGATVANIINFKKDFPDTTAIKLEQNYRSVQPILDVANHVIKNNKYRNPKKLWSERQATDCIRRVTCLSDYQEGDTIANFIALAAKQQKLSSIALLYRTHSQSRSLEEALIRASIPYKIIGGIQFYERKEIKDLLAYLRLIVNPFDRTAFFRVINCPARSLGEKFEELFYERWNAEPFATFSELSKKLIDEGAIVGAKKSSLLGFVSLFNNLTHTNAPANALHHIINGINYLAYLKKSYSPEEAQERIDNVKELIRALEHFEQNKINTIALFLDEVALMQEQSDKKNQDKDPVLLMTLHAAKGLEFHTVILAGLEEGLLPSSRALQDSQQLEEERRLFYVGITRAQERLLLTHCRYRYTYGKMSDQMPSRFLQEIPSNLAPVKDISHTNASAMQSYFQDWLKPNKQNPGATHILTFGSKKILSKPTQAASKKSPPTPVAKTKTAQRVSSSWKKGQPVTHATFGTGIVQAVEQRDNGAIFLEIQFKTGVKKIAERFVKVV